MARASVLEAEIALLLTDHLEVVGNPHLSHSPPGISPPTSVPRCIQSSPTGPLVMPPPRTGSACPDPPGTHTPLPYLPGQPRTWFVPGLVDAGQVGELLPDDVARPLADPDVRVRVVGSSPDGVPVTDATPAYRPGRTAARRVRRRDATCRFPGCGAPAVRCQLDHVEPWPGGPTGEANLVCLCATHHGFKHHSGWRLSMDESGVCTWVSPSGRSHRTVPRRAHDHAT